MNNEVRIMNLSVVVLPFLFSTIRYTLNAIR